MIMTLHKIVLVVSLLCVSMTSQAAPLANKALSERYKFPTSASRVTGNTTSQDRSPGESTRGEIESEENGELRLNTRPCERVSKQTVFKAPYEKREAGERVCRRGIFGLWRKTVKIYVVTQH